MKLSFNMTGAQRKTLVDAISQELNTPAKYHGVPTFAYEVGGYHINKTGTVTGADSLDLEDALHQKGFEAEEREYDEPDTYYSGLGGMGALPSVEELCDEGEPDRLTIEMPLDGFTEEAINNLEKLIASKASLIKKAIGAEALTLELTENTLRFPWFKHSADGNVVDAYIRFVAALCSAAKEQKRVTAHEKNVENEKFAFRVFLIRLGFIGDEYKSARKILLSNLTGNSAFKNGRPESEV